MLFKNFSKYLQRLEKTTSRNEMTEVLADLFKKCSSQEIDKACYLSLGRLGPKYEGIEFNMAEKMVIRAIASAFKTPVDKITKVYKETGDLGETGEKIKEQRAKSPPSPRLRRAGKDPAFAKAAAGRQNSKLSVSEVYNRLYEIAQESGEGSVERKIQKTATLFQELDPLSVKYAARIPVNKLRLGFSDMTILDALSWMKKGDKSLRPDLEKSFNVLADIGKIAKVAKNESIKSTKGIKGTKSIKSIKSEVGVPIRAALAERLKEPKKILEKMEGRCALEPKYDGFRVQIHVEKEQNSRLRQGCGGQAKSPLSPRLRRAGKEPAFAKAAAGRQRARFRQGCGGQAKSKDFGENLALFESKKQYLVQIFSRNLDNTTHMFPDIVAAAQKLAVKSAIIDGEAIAFNPKNGKFLPFQETVQRKRKHGVREKVKEIPLKVFAFDLLYLDGRSLLNKPFKQRRRLLEKVLAKSKGEEKGIVLTKQRIIKKATDFESFFKDVVTEGLEGLMAKKLDAVYQAGGRNFNWVKYKAGMQSELADTIDCVVMGYYKGKGKRTKFGIGAFLVGVIASKGEATVQLKKMDKAMFLTVSKIGTGLTDEQWRQMFKSLKKLEAQTKPKDYLVDKNLEPDVWCRPELVVEIEADTITRSPIHTAGLALRFPRLKRIREDKQSEDATSLSEIRKLRN